MFLYVCWFKAWKSTHMYRLPSFLCAKRMGAPYGLALGWIQPHSRYVSSCLHTSTYSVEDKWYCLGLGGWVSGSSKVMSCVMQSEGGKMGSANTSENLSNKAEIYGLLVPGAKGVQGPSNSLSSTSLAPIARRLTDGCNNINHATFYDLQTVFINDLKEHSSTQISHNDKVPSTT